MPNFPSIRAKDFLRLLLKYGCVEVGVRGSHHKIKNPSNGKITVIPVHSNRDLKKPLLIAILQQLGIDADDFLTFIQNS